MADIGGDTMSAADDPLNAIFEVTLPDRPYPGLRPFEKEEWPIFFGRETMIDAVIDRLIEGRLLVLHGDSGCGKSSLIRAGVLSRLEQENARGGIVWRTASSLPRDAPLHNLAASLARLGGDLSETEIRRILNYGRDSAAELARRLRHDDSDQICVLIDQFEELFAFARRHGREEAQLYAQFLVGVLEHKPPGMYVVVTMRSEFLGVCSQYGGLADAVNRVQYLLPRMTHADLLRAIREPATLYNGDVSLDLAGRLIGDAGGAQDQLPLIQHGLMQLHRQATQGAPKGQPWHLHLNTYLRGPRLEGLLCEHADAVAKGTETEVTEAQGIIEQLFRALTDINTDGQAIRRPRTFSQLLAVTGSTERNLARILDAFRVEGVSFLLPYGDAALAFEDLIDISHEALIRCWDRIADPKEGWLVREFHDGLIWRSLLVQAQSYEDDPKKLLSPATADERGRWLRKHSAAWADRYGGGWQRVQQLILASNEAAAEARRVEHQRLLAEESARHKEVEIQAVRSLAKAEAAKRKRTLWGLVVTGVLALITSYAGFNAWQNARLANLQASEAERAREQAQTALARLQAETTRAVSAQLQAEKAQSWAAQTVASSYSDRRPDNRLTLTDLLERVMVTQVPYEVAILAQSIASLEQPLNEEQSTQMFQHLLEATKATDDGGALRALSQAILALEPTLEFGQQGNDHLANRLIAEIRRQGTAVRIPALATMLDILARKPLPTDTAQAAIVNLIQAIPSIRDRDDLSALNRAITDLADNLGVDQARSSYRALRLSMAQRKDGDSAEALIPAARTLSKSGDVPAPRIYTHIAEEARRPAARSLTQRLALATLYGDPVMVPGIELKRGFTSSSVLRCFREWECKSDGPQLVELINRHLASPAVRLEDLSGRYARANIQARQFELWFGPGEPQLRPQPR